MNEDGAPQGPSGSIEDQVVAARRAVHEQLVASGAYPHRFDRTHLSSAVFERWGDIEPGSETEDRVVVAGRLMNTRDLGRLAFGVLQDAGGRIQLFADQRTLGDQFAAFGELDSGDWIGAGGTVMKTKKGELSVRVSDVFLLAKALRPLPEKWHGLKDVEARSRQRYVDLMVNPDSLAVALARSRIVAALRRAFDDRGFIEVETPVLLAQATGATARPFVTHHNALDLDLQLRIATELYLKRLVIGGIERVYEIGRIFRNEGLDATHSPEFTMLEAYQAFADHEDIMELVESVVSSTAAEAVGSTELDYRGRPLSLAGPYRRTTLLALVSEFVGEDVSLDSDPDHLGGLIEQHGGAVDPSWAVGKRLFELYELAHREVWEPTFVIGFPTEVSPLSRVDEADPRMTERFELVIAGAEYCNAFSELNDPIDQRERFAEQAARRAAGDDEAHVVDEEYLRALEYGLPPTGGLGIGVDRLVMLLTDQRHIREVILFPTMRPEG